MNTVKGFTLIEIMITVAILSIIAAIALPAYTGYIKTSRLTECQNEIAAIKLAEAEYFLDNNSYFIGTSASDLKSNSGDIYQPSSKALASDSECDYKAELVGTTGYRITASPATGGHLVGEADIVFSGP